MQASPSISSIFSPHELQSLDLLKLPKHIAIIPDGNRRWAKLHRQLPNIGHEMGAESLIEIVKAAKEIGIKTITFYLFSTENWNRSKEEIHILMGLLQYFLITNRKQMCEMGIRFNAIGDLSALPKEPLDEVKQTIADTSSCQEINMVVALNYGGRDEIKRALRKIVDAALQNEIKAGDVTESLIASHLDTAPFGDPDLFIRTSGESRLSNYMLWQLAYAEIHFTNVLWPDFKSTHLLEAILDYQKRERRWGN